jgi:hypothetical protein
MKLLAVNQYDSSFVASLHDICSWDRELNDLAFTKRLATSIKARGMLNPILVMTLESYTATDQDPDSDRFVDHTKPYICMIGNNRYLYALHRGYTHIECLVVNDPDRLKFMTEKLLIKPRKM